MPGNVIANFILLKNELQNKGPFRTNWPHYGKLGKNKFHCHIKANKWVVCWEQRNKKELILNIYFAGSHEDANKIYKK